MAGFNDGSNIQPTNPIVAGSGGLDLRGNGSNGVLLQLRTQTDNSDSISSATTNSVKVEMGWGQKVGTGSGALTDTITFPTAFSTIMGFMATPLGAVATTAATTITGFNSSWGGIGGSIDTTALSTSTASIQMNRSTGTFSAGFYWSYSWIAWGV